MLQVGKGGGESKRKSVGVYIPGMTAGSHVYVCPIGFSADVPADVLMAALALLARLLVGVASCLGVSLPHPLFPAASTRYAAISVDSSPRER